MVSFKDSFVQSFDPCSPESDNMIVNYVVGEWEKEQFKITDCACEESIDVFVEDLDKLVTSLQKLQQHLKENK